MTIVSTYGTTVLRGIVNEMDEFQAYLTSTFCPDQIFFEEEEIAFDKVFKGHTLAPYVSPVVAGKVNAKSGYKTSKFAVPYVKDLDQVKPQDGVKRKAGEAFTGTLTRQARVAAERVSLLGRHDQRLSMRIEEQVSQLIQTGKIVCKGDNHPTIEVDFGMSASNNITVTGAARWSQLDPAVDDGQEIIDDLETWSANANVSIDRATFEKSVWKHISKFKAVKELRSTLVRGEASTFSLAPNTNKENVKWVGTLGTLECYVYTGFYRAKDDKNSPVIQFLDTGRVILSGSTKGAVCYGAIQDLEGMQAVRQFSKNWIEKNPSAENLMSQSAPLAALLDIDSIVTVQTEGGA